MTLSIEYVCRHKHSADVMQPDPIADRLICPTCGNMNSSLFLYQRFAWARKLARRD